MRDETRRLLIDVDGVVADLNAGFCRWLYETHGLELTKEQITVHSASRALQVPALAELDHRLNREYGNGFEGAFVAYMREPDLYQRYVEPEPYSQLALDLIRHEFPHIEPVFVTAMMHEVPEGYDSKYRWLERNFNSSTLKSIRICTIPSSLKHMFGQPGDICIEDRYDTCIRWEDQGVRSLLIKQPWNEAPDGCPRYNGRYEIHDELQRTFRRY